MFASFMNELLDCWIMNHWIVYRELAQPLQTACDVLKATLKCISLFKSLISHENISKFDFYQIILIVICKISI